MQTAIQFLPAPRQLTWGKGELALTDQRLILLHGAAPAELTFAAQRFQSALQEQFALTWQLAAGHSLPATELGLTLTVHPEAVPQPEGYHLTIDQHGIHVQAHDAAGIFYAVNTLNQLLSQLATPALPTVETHDWPDYPVRGLMLDISRNKVPTMETLFALIERLSTWNVNQIQLYMEHTFAYRNHPVVWAEASPLTAEEIMALDAYCQERHIELVPNQNSFGHLKPWLIHEPYRELAETHEKVPTPWNTMFQGPFSLAPTEPGSLALLRELYDELLPNFSSRTFNVGFDETFDLGTGKSKELCEKRGVGRVYLDFLQQVYAEVTRRGYTMQFWGDIIIQHPDLIPELPSDAIALEWGYEADHPFDEHGAAFAAAGIPYYVCPGTSAWCSLSGRTDNALGNLQNAAANGLKHGSTGYLNTDWGDRGHWQQLPISYLGFAMGAAYSWCLESNRELDVPAVVSRFAFDDPSGVLGQVAYDLGNIYRVPGYVPRNSNVLFWVLQGTFVDAERLAQFEPADIQRTLAAIDTAIAPLDAAQSTRPDAGLIQAEFQFTARLLRHSCRRALLLLEADSLTRDELTLELESLLETYRERWLARNRPGGLEDSIARFKAV
ncbi:MAG: glycoside hydrolase family 20 zincin-like fold domain-containing protein [Chloroflexota bacterium]|nr:glycoside hydrolase family 20 zincin-like fold domain-containing protein [Chloroflexota bacterium]